jgi:uncharacterized protein with HEPN domain
MVVRSLVPSLTDIIEASERLRAKLAHQTFEAFEQDWEARRVGGRGLEIIFEASRRLTDQIKGRHPAIPWRKVAGIGNVLRHDYDSVAAPVIWALVQNDLAPLEQACRAELAVEQVRERKP